jgi:hypothetical protein
MNEKTWVFIDKSAWARGEWDNETDKVQWTDDDTGLPCLAVRNGFFGNWCGYVGVPREHPYYGQSYDDVPVNAHWGLTYADKCREEDKEHGICHIPDDGQSDDIWWFGFDYAHSGDVLPYRGSPFVGYDRYSTIDDVKKECASVAAQLASAE